MDWVSRFPIFDKQDTGKSSVTGGEIHTFSSGRAPTTPSGKPDWLGKKPDRGTRPTGTPKAFRLLRPDGNLSCQRDPSHLAELLSA